MSNLIIPLTKAVKDAVPLLLPKVQNAIANELGFKINESTGLVKLADLLNGKYTGVQVISGDQVTDKSAITGQPVFMPLRFKSPLNYTDENNNPVAIEEDLYIPIAICEFELEKDVIKTAVAGTTRRGTVKELINIGEYKIAIKGCFVTADGTYPATEVGALEDWCKANVTIKPNHKLFTLLGITDMVIEKMKLISKPGFQNLQFFELECCEDMPVELKILNESNVS